MKKFFQSELKESKIKNQKKNTPTLMKFKHIKIPKKAQDNLTKIIKDFKDRQATNNPNGIDYFSANFKVVDLLNDTTATGKEISAKRSLYPDSEKSIPRKDDVSSAVQLCEKEKSKDKTKPLSSITKPPVSTALAKLPQVPSVKSPTIFKTPVNRKTLLTPSVNVEKSPNSLVRVTRRTSMLALASPLVDNTPTQRNRHVMPEEITEIDNCNINETKNNSVPMAITPNVESAPRVISSRRTIFTSSAMDVTDPQQTVSSSRKRVSMIPTRFKDFEVNTKKYLGKDASNPINSQSEKSNRRRTLFTPSNATSSSSALTEEDTLKSVPNRRRTLFSMNQTSNASTSDKILDGQESSSRRETVFSPKDASSPVIPKKDTTDLRRRLFKPNTVTPSPLAVTALTKDDEQKKTNSKRRRTLLPSTHATPSPLAVSTVNKADLSVNKLDGTQKIDRRRTCFATSHVTGDQSINASQGKRNSFLFFVLRDNFDKLS